MAKHWFIDIPPEIRNKIYEEYFRSLVVYIHGISSFNHYCPSGCDRDPAKWPGYGETKIQHPAINTRYPCTQSRYINLFLCNRRVKLESEPIFWAAAIFHQSRCRFNLTLHPILRGSLEKILRIQHVVAITGLDDICLDWDAPLLAARLQLHKRNLIPDLEELQVDLIRTDYRVKGKRFIRNVLKASENRVKRLILVVKRSEKYGPLQPGPVDSLRWRRPRRVRKLSRVVTEARVTIESVGNFRIEAIDERGLVWVQDCLRKAYGKAYAAKVTQVVVMKKGEALEG